MNRHCKNCCRKEKLRKSDPNAFEEWRNSHIYKYNYQGSAGGMEIEGANRVFECSISKYKRRYTEVLDDGVSKSFLTVKNVYPETEVKKQDYVGHC